MTSSATALCRCVVGLCVVVAIPASVPLSAGWQNPRGSLTAGHGSQAEADALPRLALDKLPPPVRAGLQPAYDAARARPRDASAVGRLGMMLHAYEQYRPAEICYRIARRLAPRSMSWTYFSAVVHAELGADAVAVASFRESLRIDPAYLPARARLAEALMRAGALDDSRKEYEALIREFPELALAHYGLGRISSTSGDAAGAAVHYQRAVDLEPEFGPAHYALALAYRRTGAADRAAAHLGAYRQFGIRRPMPADRLLDEIRSMKGTARDLIAEGARLARAGRLAESIAVHLKAVGADPAHAQAHVNLISLYGRTGQPDRAAHHYRAALRLESSLAEAHYNYGVLAAAHSRYEEAAGAFRKALGADPFHAQAHNNLAALLARQGKLADAAAHYRQALANDPQHRGARFHLGRVLVALDRPLEAVEQFQKLLLPEDADTPRYLHALATAYLAAGDVTNAGEFGRRALHRAHESGQTELAVGIEASLRRMRALHR
jgi:tetratricopeptide (TPR) repeat protein